MKMKKISGIILTAAILFSTACSDNNTSSTNSQNNSVSDIESNTISFDTSSETSSDGVTDTVTENTPNNVNDTLPQFEPGNLHYEKIMKGKDGYYYYAVIERTDGSYFDGLSYYDNATGMTIPLCSKPQCMHDGNDFCTATGGLYDNRCNILYNGQIYRLGIHKTETEYTIRLLKADLQGNELSKVTDLHSNFLDETGSLPTIDYSVIFHYGKMFVAFEKNPGSQSRALFMVDLETGTSKEIYVPTAENNATRIPTSCYRTMIADGDLLYYTTREVKWNPPKMRDNAHISYDRTTMYCFNIRTGETKIISAMPDVYSSFTVNNGIIYYTVADRKENTFSLYSYDVAKDETKTIIDKHQQNYVDGKYVSDNSKITVLTDGKYLYICTRGIEGNSFFKDNADDIDFYIYSLDGKELLHGLSGMESLLDMEKEWSYTFSAIDGEIYFNYHDEAFDHSNTPEDTNSGMYVIKTEDLINGNNNWKKLYRRYI